jgi:hypothetical protein
MLFVSKPHLAKHMIQLHMASVQLCTFLNFMIYHGTNKVLCLFLRLRNKNVPRMVAQFQANVGLKFSSQIQQSLYG